VNFCVDEAFLEPSYCCALLTSPLPPDTASPAWGPSIHYAMAGEPGSHTGAVRVNVQANPGHAGTAGSHAETNAGSV